MGELAVVGDEERTRKRERSEVLEAGKAKMRRESLRSFSASSSESRTPAASNDGGESATGKEVWAREKW